MLPLDEPLIEDGLTYKTVENYYQAHKFNSIGRSIVACLDPYKAKKFASTVSWDVDRDKFDKLGVMEKALRFKFAKGTSWHKQLMETGDQEIVEWNNWGDRYWGKSVDDQKGENYLGRLLMKIREEFKG
jgi:ribA/ribD-fused uncharacterized protein